MINPTWKALIISILLLTSFMMYLCNIYENSEWISSWNSDPSAHVRNNILGAIAIASLPFLILRHLNQYKDIEQKRKDLLFRSESKLLEEILVSISNIESEMKNEDNRISKSKKIDLTDVINFSFELLLDKKIKESKKLTEEHIKLEGMIDNPEKIMDNILTNDLRIHRLNRNWTITILNVIKLSQSFQNKELKKLIDTRIGSIFNFDSLKTMLLTSLCFDYRDKSNLNMRPVKAHTILLELQSLQSLEIISIDQQKELYSLYESFMTKIYYGY